MGRHRFLQTVDIVFLHQPGKLDCPVAGIRTVGIQHEQGPGAYGFPHSLYPGSIFTDAQGTHLHLDA